jgi:hypothetical protein
MSDACEMLVAAELTLAGGCPPEEAARLSRCGCRISGRTTTSSPNRETAESRSKFPSKLEHSKWGGADFFSYYKQDEFDWLALVTLPAAGEPMRRIFIIRRRRVDAEARRNKPTAKTAHERYWRIDEVAKRFSAFENNFSLSDAPATLARSA